MEINEGILFSWQRPELRKMSMDKDTWVLEEFVFLFHKAGRETHGKEYTLRV